MKVLPAGIVPLRGQPACVPSRKIHSKSGPAVDLSLHPFAGLARDAFGARGQMEGAPALASRGAAAAREEDGSAASQSAVAAALCRRTPNRSSRSAELRFGAFHATGGVARLIAERWIDGSRGFQPTESHGHAARRGATLEVASYFGRRSATRLFCFPWSVG